MPSAVPPGDDADGMCNFCGDHPAAFVCPAPACSRKRLCADCNTIWHGHPDRLNHQMRRIENQPQPEPEPPRRSESTRRKQRNSWSCPHCTFENVSREPWQPGDRLLCQVCCKTTMASELPAARLGNGGRPPTSVGPATADEVLAADLDIPAPDSVACPTCTYLNKPKAKKCGICQGDLPVRVKKGTSIRKALMGSKNPNGPSAEALATDESDRRARQQLAESAQFISDDEDEPVSRRQTANHSVEVRDRVEQKRARRDHGGPVSLPVGFVSRPADAQREVQVRSPSRAEAERERDYLAALAQRDKEKQRAEMQAMEEAEKRKQAEEQVRRSEERNAAMQAELLEKEKQRIAAEKQRIAAEKLLEKEAREKARLQAMVQEKEREMREREAWEAREKEVREAREIEAREAREREAREREAREAREREAREAQERKVREAREREAREAQERKVREAQERKARETREREVREAREIEAREAREREVREAREREAKLEQRRQRQMQIENEERARMQDAERTQRDREMAARSRKESEEAERSRVEREAEEQRYWITEEERRNPVSRRKEREMEMSRQPFLVEQHRGPSQIVAGGIPTTIKGYTAGSHLHMVETDAAEKAYNGVYGPEKESRQDELIPQQQVNRHRGAFSEASHQESSRDRQNVPQVQQQQLLEDPDEAWSSDESDHAPNRVLGRQKAAAAGTSKTGNIAPQCAHCRKSRTLTKNSAARFECFYCHKHTCKDCGRPWEEFHNGRTCQEYERLLGRSAVAKPKHPIQLSNVKGFKGAVSPVYPRPSARPQIMCKRCHVTVNVAREASSAICVKCGNHVML